MNILDLPRHKFQWVAKLYKDGDSVSKSESVRVSRLDGTAKRPPLTICATADECWNAGGEMALTFMRKGVEDCDEIWLGVVQQIGDEQTVIEEWELREVKKLPPRLYTSHIPGDIEYEDDEGEETLKFSFGNMSYRCNVKMGFGDDNVGKWTNYSTL